MNKRNKIILGMIFAAIIVALAIWYISGLDIAILQPKGVIAQKEYDLLVFTTLLGFVVIIPVFVMAIVIAWRYREGNTKATYTPNASDNRVAETIWWSIPIILIAILSVVTWNSTHDLDPSKPLVSNVKPITIQVVALEWKWLFIYPEQDIATVNLIQFPINTPINFEITSDAPMNSFWIPQLSGQIYAMAGMTTKLHLNATEKGDYKGSSANISGEGFSGMKFTARATSTTDFNKWIASIKKSPNNLSLAEYKILAKKSKSNPEAFYASSADDLYDTIIMKYMMPETNTKDSSPSTTSDMYRTAPMKEEMN